MKKIMAFALTILMLTGLLTMGIAANDGPTGSKYYNGHYYKYFEAGMTWTDAAEYCEKRGGHLATITSASENEFIMSLFSCESVWIGGNDVSNEGEFRWCTGESFVYSNWNAGEPNNGGSGNQDYIHMYKSGKWDDMENNRSLIGFICEWDSWTPNTNISIPSDALLHNNHYYKLYTLEYDWEEASYHCEKIGGHLVTISDAEENSFVNNLVQSQNIWLGGSDISNEGIFEWVTGESFLYKNWTSGEPNNGSGNQDCIQMYANGLWDDEKYSAKKYFVCEWDYCCISESGYSDVHTWNEWFVYEDATCHMQGKEARVCQACGELEVREMAILEHKWSEWQTVVASTCNNSGKEERECVFCSDIESRDAEQLTHDYGEWSTKTDATCHAQGEQIRKCCDCEAFESRTTDILEHQWQDWSVSVAATCNNAGSDERHCRLCGNVEHRDVAQLTHEYSEYVVVRGSKLIPPIVKEKTCQLCGDIETQEDWSNIWITIIAVVALLGICVGVINYIRVFRKK